VRCHFYSPAISCRVNRTIKTLSVRNGCADAEAEAASKKLLDLTARRPKETEQRKKEREERRLRRARELGSAVRVFAKRVARFLDANQS
jgi:ribosomal protein L5